MSRKKPQSLKNKIKKQSRKNNNKEKSTNVQINKREQPPTMIIYNKVYKFCIRAPKRKQLNFENVRILCNFTHFINEFASCKYSI